MSPREAVEIFHLLFLRYFFASLEDRTLVVVKGGCNLRFFFGSPRFSEDLDLDVRTVRSSTLRGRVDGVLSGTAFRRVLAANRISIAGVSAPKQTEDVQRWKMRIVPEGGLAESTRIEFSRRGAGTGATDPIPSEVLARHRLPPPIIATHYPLDAAFAQKIAAVLGRKVPQARDVFDLHLLLGRGARVPRVSATDRAAIHERVLAFSEDDFRGQVVAYLEPEEQAIYQRRDAIDAVQLRVAEAFE